MVKNIGYHRQCMLMMTATIILFNNRVPPSNRKGRTNQQQGYNQPTKMGSTIGMQPTMVKNGLKTADSELMMFPWLITGDHSPQHMNNRDEHENEFVTSYGCGSIPCTCTLWLTSIFLIGVVQPPTGHLYAVLNCVFAWLWSAILINDSSAPVLTFFHCNQSARDYHQAVINQHWASLQ